MEELKKYLENNKKIELEKLFPERIIKRFRTAFYKAQQQDLYFFKPKDNENIVDVVENEIVRILVYTNNGVYVFKSQVLKCGSKLIKINTPKEYKKVQRREFLRAVVHMKAYTLDNYDKKHEIDVNNISGNGFSFNTNDNLKNSKKIIICFEIANKTIKTIAQIINVRKNINPKLPKYRVGAKFMFLKENDKEFIIQQTMLYNSRSNRII